MFDRRDVGIATGIYLLAFSVYFLTYAGYPISDDERAMFASASSFQRIGTFTIHPLYHLDVKPGSANVGMFTTSGEMVPNYEPGQIVAIVPWLWLSDRLGTGRFQTAMLLNPMVIAGSAALLYLIVRSLPFPPGVAILTALFYAFGTAMWPYSQRLFREPPTGAWLLLAFGAPFLFRNHPDRGFFLMGLALGGAVATKQSALIALPGLFWLSFSLLRGHSIRDMVRRYLIALLGFGLITIPAHIYYRMTLSSIPAFSRNVVEYARSPELALSDPWHIVRRALALTISPGKGLLFYSPALALAGIGAWGFLRTHRDLALGIFGFAALHTLGYSRQIIWWGGLNWGPRYMIPLLPVMMLAAAPGIAVILRWPPRRARATLLFLALIALFPQLAGTLVDIRLFEGELDRALYQVLQDYHRAMEQVAWNPAYNPLLGQWKMLGRADPAPAWIRDHQLILAPVGIGAIGVLISLGILGSLVRRFDLPSVWTTRIMIGTALVMPLLAVASLRQIADDPRLDFHENARFLRPMIEDLNREARPGDVLLMTYPYFGDYFLNWLRAPIDWYGIFSSPSPLPEPRRALLDRLLTRHSRIWLMRPWNRWHEQEPGLELYLLDHAYKVNERHYEDWMRLVLYLSPRGSWEPVKGSIRWENDVALIQAALQGGEVQAGEGLPVLQAQPGDPLRLTLVWRGPLKVLRAAKVFVHIGDPDQPPRLQQDRLPRDGWLPNDPNEEEVEISDRYGFVLALPPGVYRVRIGLYDEASGKRWPSESGEAIDLMRVEIR
ncbi:ArnT family glycosyltransferase [Thermoflexus hugenholtzii]